MTILLRRDFARRSFSSARRACPTVGRQRVADFFVVARRNSGKVISYFVCSGSQYLVLSIWYFRKGHR